MTGAKLKAWRRKVGVTQRQLAALLDVPALTISAWETGRIEIKRPVMLALACRALELEISRLASAAPRLPNGRNAETREITIGNTAISASIGSGPRRAATRNFSVRRKRRRRNGRDPR
jgi:transcriptional regulator with XRE-family HTH domain